MTPESHRTRLPLLVRSLFISSLLNLALPAWAQTGMPSQPREAPTRLSEVAQQWVMNHHPWTGLDVQVTALPPDTRLQLRRCAHAPTAELPPGGRIRSVTTVRVRCEAPESWQTHLRVESQAWGPVLVLQQPVQRAEPVQPQQLRSERRDVAVLEQGYLTQLPNDRPLRFKYALTTGQVLLPQALEADAIIRRGQEVRLVSERLGGVRIAVVGRALTDAAPGERVRVENTSSRRVVEGIAVAGGEVRLQ